MLAAGPAADLWSDRNKLSVGDRAGLALAKLTDATAITADGRWLSAGTDVDVRVIRYSLRRRGPAARS
jgi:PIN domain nuclease of toxin-antitoxin system